MIINKNVWYMKLINFYSREEPKNLCELVRSIFVCAGVTILFLTIACLLLFLCLYAFAPQFTDDYDPAIFALGVLLNGFFVWHLSGYMVDYYGVRNFATKPFHFPHASPDSSVVKTTTLLSKYVKAVHDKTCPIIEYKS